MTKKQFFITDTTVHGNRVLAAFLFVLPAFAQDEHPPEVSPTEAPAEAVPNQAASVETLPTEVTPPVVVPTEAAPAEVLPIDAAPEEVLPTEAAPKEELPVEAAPAEEAPAAEPNLAETLADSGVVLAIPSGEVVTLAAQSTEDLIATGDPYFTVGSRKYRFILSGSLESCADYDDWYYCDDLSSTPIQESLNYLAINNLTPTDRKLYIEAGNYNENVNVDGRWRGVKGLLEIVGLPSPTNDVVINGQLNIHHFLSGFSVSNVTVNNLIDPDSVAIYAHDNKGTIKLTDVNARADGEDSSGIIIKDSAVELNRVNASDNAYHGLLIPWVNGSIKITNSTFDHNLLKRK